MEPPPSPVLQRLWLGGGGYAHSSFDQAEVDRLGITHIVSVCKYDLCDKVKVSGDSMHIAIEDEPTEDLTPHLVPAARFIHAARVAGGCVYVHCYWGGSRSATILWAYLMMAVGMTIHQGLEYLIQARATVRPNPGFIAQIKHFNGKSGDGGYQMERLRLKKDFGGGRLFVASAALLMSDAEDIKNKTFTDPRWKGEGEREKGPQSRL